MARNSGDDYDPYADPTYDYGKPKPSYPTAPVLNGIGYTGTSTGTPNPWSGVPSPSSPVYSQYQQDNPTYQPGTSATGAQVTATGQPDWAAGPWDSNRLRNYFASRGVTADDSLVNSWMGYWNKWGTTDPKYYFARLQNDESFGGPRSAPTTTPNTLTGGLGNFTPEAFTPPPTVTGAATTGAPNGSDASSLFQYLMGRAKQSLAVSPNDPIIKAQTDAFRATQTRSGRDYLKAQAERRGPYGGANARTDARIVSQNVGANTSAHEAQLLGSDLAARRNEIIQSLALAQNQLSNQQRIELDEELAQLNSALGVWQTKQSLGAGESQFRRNLAQRAYEFDSNQQYLNSPASGA